ncbi:hypothetical protein [Phocaeicola plebeius]
MTKEELLEKLIAKVGKTSLSERTLSAYAENTLKLVGDDSQVDDAFLEAHASILKTMEGQLSHEISSGIEKWKEGNNLKKEGGEDDTNEILELMKQIREDNAALKARLDEADKKQGQKDYKARLMSEMRSKGAENEYILKQTIGQKEFDTAKSVEDAVEESLKAYDANYKSCFGDGATPRGNSGNGTDGNDTGSKALDAFFDRKAAEGKFPKAE